MIAQFIAGLLYRAALNAQQCGLLDNRMVYPIGQPDAFKVLLCAMGWYDALERAS